MAKNMKANIERRHLRAKSLADLVCIFVLTVGALVCMPSRARAEVWTATNVWSAEQELNYQTWVKEHFDRDIFLRATEADGTPNPLAGLNPDCADTVYSARIVYAWRHSLPVAFNDPTGGSIKLTNRMSRWDRVTDPAQRIRRFLAYIFDMMGTPNLAQDTYPIAVNAQTIRPGTILLTTRQNHHSLTVKDISEQGVPHFIYSTVGQATDGRARPLLQRHSWPQASWVFEGNFTVRGNAGFRFWRSEEDLGKPVAEVVGFSDEQYTIPLNQWVRTIQSRLAISQETAAQRVERFLTSSCQFLQERVPIVQTAAELMAARNNACLEYREYDDQSTPARDRRWFLELRSLRAAYIAWKASPEYNEADPMVAKLAKVFPNLSLSAQQENQQMAAVAVDDNSQCSVEYAPGKTIDLAEAKRRLFLGLMSSNPLDTPSVRWGDAARQPNEVAATCPSWDPWVPNFNDSLD